MESMKVVFILLLLHLIQYLNASNIIKTEYGEIEGFKYLMKNGKNANIFLGIPYASPPIEDLRLEKPQPPKLWNSTLEAKKFGSRCSPHNAEIVQWFGAHSEDCLYLNIFAPEISETSKTHPVAVWIHGGGFCFGDSEIYGYKQLAENFVSRGIIIVTLQYRLGPFGFFSLGDHNLPGNLGLWDQRQALLFLHKVLPAFGGDKERITVWGHSAGGTSASLLSASPHTRGFKKS
uniref:Carboxylic ester hydrolase n=1 Tax=Panagrolaimus superbus TaxID=310955 RepID=A0A914ZEY8_9BILA